MPARAKRSGCIGLAAWLILATFALANPAAYRLGYRLNTTPSLPRGLWRVSSLTRPLARGDIVSFCPPPTPIFLEAKTRFYLSAGACPGGFEPMLKPVVGLPGDSVEASEEGLAVNGTLPPNSKPLAIDASGRPLIRLAPGRFTLGQGLILLVSSYNPQSFDGRYFGPLPTSTVQGQALPILVAAR